MVPYLKSRPPALRVHPGRAAIRTLDAHGDIVSARWRRALAAVERGLRGHFLGFSGEIAPLLPVQ